METLKKILNHRIILIAGILFCLLRLGQKADKYFGYSNGKYGTHTLSPVMADGTGYYFYLTSLFVLNSNSDADKIFEEEYRPYNYNIMLNRQAAENKYQTKFFSGTAILQSPFFLINHAIQSAAGKKNDGYSYSYMLTISLCGIFFWLAGILGFVKLLRHFNLSNSVILLGVIALSFGTNLFYYATVESSASHVYSFFAVNWFLVYCFSWAKSRKNKDFLLICLLLGLVFIIRPVNGLVVLILPFCFLSFKDFISVVKLLFAQYKILIIGICLFLFPIFLHCLLQYFVNGQFRLNAYEGEGFTNLFAPKILDVLFSYRKGLFIYAPVLCLFFPAIIFLFLKNRYFAFGLLLTLFCLTWFISSWWYWSYGGSLGSRPYVEFLGLLFLPVLLMFQRVSWFFKFLLSCAVGLGIYIYSVYQYQYDHHIIHYDNMDKDKFSSVFLKEDFRFEWKFHNDHPVFNKRLARNPRTLYYDINNKKWTVIRTPATTIQAQSDEDLFALELPFGQLPENAAIRFEAYAKINNPNSLLPINFEIWKADVKQSSESRVAANQIKELNNFEPVEAFYIVPKREDKPDFLRIVFHGQNAGDSYKDIKVTIYDYGTASIR